jgi:imidazole glycerol-phosphate synthase subunit HisF
MALKRIIARLDIKLDRVIKGMHLEGWRFLEESPGVYCSSYYQQGIDEIIYLDVVASLYGRGKLEHLVSDTTRDVFVPITAGGGIRSAEDASDLLRAGADKVAVCSGAIKDPSLVKSISRAFGAQCCVLSVQAKKRKTDGWNVFYDVGRENSGRDLMDWILECVELGAGEILLTSIDNEGTRKGYDLKLIETVSKIVNIPVIASGGYGKPEHAVEAFNAGADAIAIAYGLHYNQVKIPQLKEFISKSGIQVRI